MYKIHITKDARADIKSVSRYTLKTWGADQMRRYSTDLKATIFKLENNPEQLGQDRSERLSGLRSISHDDHYFIFYRIKGKTVEILRVLHQRRNWQKFFGN